MKTSVLALSILTGSLLFFSCKKEDETKVDDKEDANAAPTCVLSFPSDEYSVDIHQTDTVITFLANAGDSDGSVVKVEFFLREVHLNGAFDKVGEDITGPYELQKTLGSSIYELKAVATDDKGKKTTSSVNRFSLVVAD